MSSSLLPRDPSVPVLVLDAGYGGLGVARSLGRWGVPVYATCSTPGSPVLASRYWKETFAWDFASAPGPDSVRFLLEVGRRIGRRAILMPTTDVTVMFVAEQGPDLEDRFIFTRQSAALVRRLVDKRELYALAARMGMPTARTVFPASRRDVEEFLEQVGFPIVAKGTNPRLPGGTAKTLLRAREDALACYERAAGAAPSAGDPPNLTLQEFIPGGDDAVWMFDGYFDRAGRCLAAFTGRKLRQYPAYVGVTSLGVCMPNQQIEEMSRAFLGGIQYQGPVDIDYRFDARERSYKILDVNPRIGATSRLFVDSGGLDVARTCYLDLTGQPVVAGLPCEGRKWLLEEDLLASLRYRRDGRLSLYAWVRSLVGVRETAWFARDDLGPLLARVRWAVGSVRRHATAAGPRASKNSWARSSSP